MKGQVPISEKISYSSGLLGQNMIYNFVAMYIMFYFTDILCIPTAVATVIVVIASLWDAINDPMMGIITDRTRTKYGKFRPYMIFGPVFIMLTTIFCFVNFGLSAMGAIIFAGVCYILWGMSYTLCDIPIWAITSTVSTLPEERTTMVTLGKIGGTIGTVIVSVLSVTLLNMFGGERVGSAYTWVAILFAVIGGVLMILAGIKTKERIAPEKEVMSIRKNLKTITANKPLQALMIALVITNLVNGVRQASQLYFVVYVWGDSSMITPIGLSLVIGMTLGMIIAPKLVGIMEKKNIFFIFSLFGAVTSVVPMFAQSSIIIGLIFLGLSFLSTGVISIVCATMLLDAVEYSEWKLGYRGEGIIFSINTFLTKLSATFSKLILGVCLIVIGYVENMQPTALVQSGISSLMYVIPAVSFLISMIPMIFYTLTEEKRKEIHSELEAKRG
ncbi:MAG: glycoside-pentoside-hexuronide (GPH):cation symporter [Bacillota bacterium]